MDEESSEEAWAFPCPQTQVYRSNNCCWVYTIRKGLSPHKETKNPEFLILIQLSISHVLLKALCMCTMQKGFKHEWLLGLSFWLSSYQIFDQIFQRSQLSLCIKDHTDALECRAGLCFAALWRTQSFGKSVLSLWVLRPWNPSPDLLLKGIGKAHSDLL